MKVVVVGGGLSGIAAALRLHDEGAQVTLLEASDRLGGKAVSTTVGGHTLELGPQSFVGRREPMWRLLKRLDLEAVKLGDAAKTRFVIRDGKMHALASPFSIFGLLSLGEIMRALKEPFIGKASKEESVRDFFARRIGQTAGAFLAETMITGIYAGDPAALSITGCFAALAGWEKKHGSLFRGARRAPKTGQAGTFGVKGGFAAISARAREILGSHVRLGAQALHITAHEVVLPGGESIAADAIIVACEAREAAAIVPVPLANVLREFQSAPVTVVHFTGAAQAPRGFGFIAPANENAFCLGTVFSGDLRGSPTRYFTALIGGTRQAARAALPELALRRGINADLQRFGFGQIDNILHVQRWAHAVAQPMLGHDTRVAEARKMARSVGLTLAGSYLGSSAMHDALQSGETAAAEILQQEAADKPMERAS